MSYFREMHWIERLVRLVISLGFWMSCTLGVGQTEANPTSSVAAWSAKIADLATVSPDSAKGLAEEQLTIALAQQDWPLAGELQAILGDLALEAGNFGEALGAYETALAHLQSDPTRTEWRAEEIGILMLQANILLAQDRYIDAHAKYSLIQELSEDSESFAAYRSHATNNLGVLFMRLEDYPAATAYFEEAKRLFERLSLEYNSMICAYNLAEIAARQGLDSLALSGYSRVAQRMSELQQWGDYVNCHTAISRIHRLNGRYDLAQLYLDIGLEVLASDLLTSEAPVVLHRTDTHYNAAELARATGDIDRAMVFGTKCFEEAEANNLQDLAAKSSLLLSDLHEMRGDWAEALRLLHAHLAYQALIEKESSIREIVQLQMSHAFERQMQEAKLEELERSAERDRKNAFLTKALLVTLVVALALGVLFLLQRNIATKAQLREASLELEKKELNNSLVYKSKELTTTMMYLLEKNQFITSIANELVESKHEFSQKNQAVIQRIINELLKNSSQKAWEEFEVHFKEVHFAFYEILQKTFPDLTVNEKRLCAFLRLNLTTKEIAAITHQSVKSINMARFRMRKKMNLESDVDLAGYLAAL